MKRIFKAALWLLGALVLLIVIAAVAVSLLFDPNDYRDEINALVERHTGRELLIEGDLELSLFPWLGLTTGKTRLGNAPGFGPEPFAQVSQAKVRVKLLPLLRRKVELDTVTLEGLQLHLARNAQGKNNWDDLVAKATAPEPEAPPIKERERAPTTLTAGGLELTKSVITWDDQVTGRHATLRELNLEAGALDLASPFPVRFTTDFESRAPAVSGRLQLAATITIAPQEQRYAVEELLADLALAGKALPNGRMDAHLAGTASADLAAGTATLQRLEITALGTNLRLTGSIRQPGDSAGGLASYHRTANGLPEQFVAQGRLQIKVEQGERLLSPFAKTLPANFKAEALSGASLDGEYALDWAAERLRLPDLRLSVASLDLRADVTGTDLRRRPELQGEITVAEFAPRNLADKLGIALPTMADPNTLNKAAASSRFEASVEHLALTNLDLRLDDTTLKGRCSARRFARPVVRYDLTLDRLDFDRYLPPPTEEPTPPPRAGKTTAGSALPTERLRRLDIEGTVRVGALKAANLRSQSVLATLRAQNGLFRVNPAGAQLYGGQYAGNLRFDVRRAEPELGMDERLSGVQMGPLLKDFMGRDYVTGRAQLTARLNARGTDTAAIRRTLSGNARFALQDGSVNGINIAQLIRDAKAKLEGRPAPKESPRRTDFAELTGTVTVTNGLVDNRDLDAKSPLLRVAGRGTVNLVTEALDYRLDTTVVSTLEGQGGSELQELAGLTVPIRIRGTFRAPRFDVPLDQLLEERAQKALDAEQEKAEQRLEEEKKKAEDELKRRLEEEAQKLQKSLENKLNNLKQKIF